MQWPESPHLLPRGRRGLLTCLTMAVILAAAVSGGYALGRLHQAQQARQGLVTASFVHFKLAPGWFVAGKTSTEVSVEDDAGDSMLVQLGNADKAGIASDEDVFRLATLNLGGEGPGWQVGSCLPLTQVMIGGKSGLEVGLLYHPAPPAPQEDCELVWTHVDGSRFYAWFESGGEAISYSGDDSARRIAQRVRAVQEMQETAVWTR